MLYTSGPAVSCHCPARQSVWWLEILGRTARTLGVTSPASAQDPHDGAGVCAINVPPVITTERVGSNRHTAGNDVRIHLGGDSRRTIRQRLRLNCGSAGGGAAPLRCHRLPTHLL